MALMGLYSRDLAPLRSIAWSTGLFAEITRRRADAASYRLKCSLMAFLGRERQRAVNG